MVTSLQPPATDPTPIFEHFRGNYATELLTAAVAHFNLFGRLAQASLPLSDLGTALGLAERPTMVLTTALRAMGLLTMQGDRLALTPLALEHLVPGAAFDVGDYVGLAAGSPGVLEMVERLKTNRPAAKGAGTAFIYREGVASAMEDEASARHFTLALAGRARNVAPLLAERVPLEEAKVLLDVAGGTGIYSIACLAKNPQLRAIVLDRPEVLKVAQEMALAHGVADRLECRPADMFRDPLPNDVDAILLSNVLHDWDMPDCRRLVRRCADGLTAGGKLVVHDVFLNDDHGGPLPVALYSAALFTLTEGRAYSAAEYRGWLHESGLAPSAATSTLIHCGVIVGTK
jgi:SAM-dependent methyltransferase